MVSILLKYREKRITAESWIVTDFLGNFIKVPNCGAPPLCMNESYKMPHRFAQCHSGQPGVKFPVGAGAGG